MSDYYPRTITFEGYTCNFLERPLSCRGRKCKHAYYCRSCDACGMTVEGFNYHGVNDNGEFDFHPRCVKLEPQICIDDVIFRLQKRGPSNCLWCNKRRLKGTSKNIPGWSYVSNHMGYSFHVNCVMEMGSNNPTGSSGSGVSELSEFKWEGSEKTMTMKKKSKWVEILQGFLRTVFSILFGDPPTFLASTLAHFLTLP